MYHDPDRVENMVVAMRTCARPDQSGLGCLRELGHHEADPDGKRRSGGLPGGGLMADWDLLGQFRGDISGTGAIKYECVKSITRTSP